MADHLRVLREALARIPGASTAKILVWVDDAGPPTGCTNICGIRTRCGARSASPPAGPVEVVLSDEKRAELVRRAGGTVAPRLGAQ
ncbi:hypothetical protein ACFZAR_30520 [Streptomyces sp. NPDC008222]|uniref:hypothetical protein n=1 Tax=Streptomyces sp. NPDC008222 TaxID=3364820 RepID=UPI0036F02153